MNKPRRRNSGYCGSALAIVAVVCFACSQHRSSESVPASTPAGALSCTPPGRAIDSTFAVERARGVLEQPGLTLEPRSIQPIRDQGIELGLLISLAVVQPANVVGGGGLVWVDVETGCPIVLRRYE